MSNKKIISIIVAIAILCGVAFVLLSNGCSDKTQTPVAEETPPAVFAGGDPCTNVYDMGLRWVINEPPSGHRLELVYELDWETNPGSPTSLYAAITWLRCNESTYHEFELDRGTGFAIPASGWSYTPPSGSQNGKLRIWWNRVHYTDPDIPASPGPETLGIEYTVAINFGSCTVSGPTNQLLLW